MRAAGQNRSLARIGLGLTALVLAASCAGDKKDPSPDAPLAASIQLSTNVIHVGDSIEAVLTVYHPTNGVLVVPDPHRERALVVRDQKRVEEPATGAHRKTVITYALTSLELGNHLVSTGRIDVVQSGEPTHSISFPDALITVRSLLDDPNVAMQDIKDLLAWPKGRPYWIVALALIALLALAAGLIASRVLKRKQKAPPPAPVIPPHERAIKALRDLKAKGWIEAGDVEPFYVELSSIVRHYIEGRFEIRAPEQTTEEFIRSTAGSEALPEEHRPRVVSFLEQSDLVKFARYQPGSDAMEAAFTAAEELVMTTRPGGGAP